MRTLPGVPKWPDPTIDSQGPPVVLIYPWKLGVDPDSNQVNTEMKECRQVEHPEVPTPMVEYLPLDGEGRHECHPPKRSGPYSRQTIGRRQP